MPVCRERGGRAPLPESWARVVIACTAAHCKIDVLREERYDVRSGRKLGSAETAGGGCAGQCFSGR
jgi:hypothetical protein